MPLQSPTVSATHIAFVYADEIWIVDRKGGTAHRLTSQTGLKGFPVFSPDGSQVAFARILDGNIDVYVAALTGGEPRRLTYHPKGDLPVAWTPDGKNILFTSQRIFDGGWRFYTVPMRGGFPTELPLPVGWEGSFSPDGSHIAYIPFNGLTFTWRNYRGGLTTKIWIANLADSSIQEIPRENSNDSYPMWIGDNVYFVSDRNGTDNLFVYETGTKRITQLTNFEKRDVKFASASTEAIVFIQSGAIHLYDLKTKQVKNVEIRIVDDFADDKPHPVKAARWISDFDISPNGTSAVFGARGEILTFNTETRATLNLSQTVDAAERFPIWSPDGNYIAYFSDESGEYQLHIRAINGGGVIRKISVERNPSFYNELVWAPDSKKLAFSDKRLALWYVDLDRGMANRVDNSTFAGQADFQPVFSPDSQWLAYSMHRPNRLRAIFVHHLATARNYQISDGRTDSEYPVFDRNGKYLYFAASGNAGPSKFVGQTALLFEDLITRRLQMVLLQKDTVSPLGAKEIPPEKERDRKSVTIDIEGIGQRVLPLPLPVRDYVGLAAGKPGILFIMERSWVNPLNLEMQRSQLLTKFDVSKGAAEKFVEGATSFKVSSDGTHLIFQKGRTWSIVETDTPPKTDEGNLDLSRGEIQIDPRAEWRQMFNEVWRFERDYFYDPNHHGQDLAALKKMYAAYLPNVVTRRDLNLIFNEMLSHLSVGHMTAGGGDIPSQASSNVGLLGADYKINNGSYRITKIYRGDNSQPLLTGPLSQPGLDVKEGDYLLAVDGQEIKPSEELFSQFVGKAGKTVELTVASEPDGTSARRITVVPLPGEATLRRYDWSESNRRRVEELSGGKLAYIYLSNLGETGLLTFIRDFYGQIDKQGLIIDERFNGGGSPGDYILETLSRSPLAYYTFRDGQDLPFPAGLMTGPKILMINESDFSTADTFPFMFRQAKLGSLVGMRTAGGGVGFFVDIPRLIDGGAVSSPNRAIYNHIKGVWDVENHGVAPDVEVETLPTDWRAGRDPQLEAAVRIALESLGRNLKRPPTHPEYPAYK